MSEKNSAIAVLGSKKNLPAHLRERESRSKRWDELVHQPVPRIEISKRHLTAVVGGQVVAKSKDPIVVAILDASPVGRAFYAKSYTPGESAMPDCYSVDGVKPAKDAKDKQARRCDDCPQNVKGSSKTKSDSKACRYRQNLAVALPGNDHVFRLPLSATSIFPQEAEEDGGLALQAYIRQLKGIDSKITPDMVWTQVALAEEAENPCVRFLATGWIDDEDDDARFQAMIESEECRRAINATEEDAEEADEDDEDDEPAPRRKARARVDDDEEDDEPAPRRRARAKDLDDDEEDDEPAPRRRARAADLDDDDDDDDDEPAPRRKARAPVEEDEDDEPAPRRRARRAPVEDDEDDEAPAPRRRPRRAPVDEDEDDEPAPRRRTRRAPVEDDEDDEPAPRRKRRAAVDEEEDAPARTGNARRRRRRDEDEDDDEPAPRRRAKAPVDDDEDEDAPRVRKRGSSAIEDALEQALADESDD